jgi:predicted secreted protein
MTRALRAGVAVLALAAVLGAPSGCARKTIYGEGTPRIDTAAGRDVVIDLPSDPTSGHDWRIGALPDARVLALLSADYVPGATPEGGRQRFTFRAVGSGTTTARFDYGRPWAAPVKSTTFTVVVR